MVTWRKSTALKARLHNTTITLIVTTSKRLHHPSHPAGINVVMSCNLLEVLCQDTHSNRVFGNGKNLGNHQS